jgi:ABC-type multidrug transport system permease subunit
VSDGIRALQQKGLGAFVVVGIFLLIFLSIKGVMFFVQWPVLIFAFMLYLLLQAIGIISIGAEMRQKEVIIVK